VVAVSSRLCREHLAIAGRRLGDGTLAMHRDGFLQQEAGVFSCHRRLNG
jgi:hypothetical protein